MMVESFTYEPVVTDETAVTAVTVVTCDTIMGT